ncbi:DUF4232 domain-containing protein [Streptomyces sp. I05A-00742]|uniref:DUF4232 domain-containing protein n=1 Tax=Streptomyces sp. I05A-00742 TaxID=2732853 RepID=UPI001488DDF0|nr:DUF4232 domain-containing protein [Streptomyces sp. I05A-00742]
MNWTEKGRRPLGVLLVVCAAGLTGCAREEPARTVREAAAPSPAAASGPAAGRTPSTPTATPDPCPREGVRVMAGTVDGAMGLRALTVQLVNCGTAPHTVDGRPDVRVLGERGQALDVTVHDDLTTIAGTGVRNSAPRPVTLRPGQAAEAVVMWRNTYDDPSRPPLLGRRLKVAPAVGEPGQTIAPEGGVDLGSTGKLAVGPWKPMGG